MELFVSYAHLDLLKVKALVDVLRQAGHRPWFDEQLKVGREWQPQLEEAIQRCGAFVYALTPLSLDSEWCQWEFVTAIKHGKPIIPVILDDMGDRKLPLSIRNYQYLDVSNGFTADLVARLTGDLNELAALIPPDQAPLVPTEPAGEPSRSPNIQQSVTISETSGGTVNIAGTQSIASQTNIDTQYVGEKTRDWTLPVILGLLLAIIGTAAAVVAILPETQRNHLLYQINLIGPSETPDATMTPIPSIGGSNVGVVVAQFQVPQDGSVDPAAADQLVERISNRLEPELQEAARQLDLTLGFLGPVQVGRVTGETADERESNARNLAEIHDADIVVYGVISRNKATDEIEIQPQFYVAPSSFYNALEMTGSFRLGNEIQINPPINDALDAERNLSDRIASLAHTLSGIVSYVDKDYGSALQSFQLAAGEVNWEEVPGREVLHVLIGNTYLRMVAEAALACDRARVLELIEAATNEYRQAASIAPQYSRSYAGLASSSYLKAAWSPDTNVDCSEGAPQSVDLTHLQEVLTYEASAENAIDQPRETGVLTLRLFSKAQALFMLWLTDSQTAEMDDTSLQDEFQRTTDQIIRNYENGDYPAVGELAVEAFIMRGLGLQTEGDCRSAVQEFDNALEIEELSNDRAMFIHGWIGQCYQSMGQLERAVAAVEEALSLADRLGLSRQIEKYETLLTELDTEIQAR